MANKRLSKWFAAAVLHPQERASGDCSRKNHQCNRYDWSPCDVNQPCLELRCIVDLKCVCISQAAIVRQPSGQIDYDKIKHHPVTRCEQKCLGYFLAVLIPDLLPTLAHDPAGHVDCLGRFLPCMSLNWKILHQLKTPVPFEPQSVELARQYMVS